MKIIRLKLKNYRNCEDIELDLNNKKILIVGKNAQGKTNILESIYFLSTLKSQRTTNNIELINFSKENVEIQAEVEKSNTQIDLAFYYDKEKKREIYKAVYLGLHTNPYDRYCLYHHSALPSWLRRRNWALGNGSVLQ